MSHQGCAGTAVTRGRIIVPQALGVQTSKKACKVEEARVLSPNLLPSSNGPPPQNRGQVPFGILSKILVPLPTTRHPQPCNKRQSGEGCRTTDVLDPAQGLKLCQPPSPCKHGCHTQGNTQASILPLHPHPGSRHTDTHVS